MKKVLSLILALVLLLSIVGCGSNSASKNNGKKQITIAYLTPGLDLPYWKYLSEGIKQEAKKTGAKVQVYDSHNDSATQLKNAQDAIVKNVSAIILSPTDSSTAPAVLKKATEANIPVIIADIGTDSGEYASLVISKNKEGAKQVGQYLAKYMKSKGWNKGPVAQVTISLARQNGKLRTNGFKEAMDAAGIKIADIKQMKKYTRSEAEGFAQDLMTAYPNLHAIFGQTDEPTLGVLKAVEESHKSDQIAVVGFDATPETIKSIKEGKMLAASVQQPVLMGQKSMELASKVLNGKKVDKQVLIPTILVTKDNVSKVQATLDKTVFPKKN